MTIKTLLKRFTKEPPLGWAQLSHQKVRMIVALSGIAFADILIFMQLGFHTSLFGGITRIHEHLNGDLLLVSARAKTLIDGQNFSHRHLYQAAAVDGIAAANPFYYSNAGWINPWEKKVTSVAILAFDPAHPVLDLPEVNQQLEKIKLPDKVLVDRLARPDLGPIAATFEQGKPIKTEISERRISVGGMFTLGSTLWVEGYLITSDWNYLRLYGKDSIDNVTVGVLKVDTGAEVETVKQKVRATLPSDVAVMTHQEFITAEKDFWAENHPAGTIFNFGVAMGFVVGVVIVYQVLFADVNDHLAEYATLKAMGYPDKSLLAVVFQEAIILAVLGFIPGFGVSIGMYGLLETLTKMPLAMQSDVALRVFFLTVTMCLASGAIAIRKLQSADPAEVF
ncbi:ABC transporter permease DevC [Pleurocapsa sp. PCC 7319]|uniref:ABC transporter permease DevC n=1 Tax=Pleurocapsa sp. PCC 7319 TaxID=118161 RepID=UPI0003488F62|nr:ABC transporter permease DevC [Pleurocapsa sp. PCC 7319]